MQNRSIADRQAGVADPDHGNTESALDHEVLKSLYSSR